MYAVVCSAQLHGGDSSPRVEAKNNFTKHPWGIYDFINGLIMGGYPPLAGLARASDCFSRYLDWGVRMADMPHYFDKGFDINEWGDWFGIFFKLFFFGFATYNTAAACFLERSENREIWKDMKEDAQNKRSEIEVEEFQAEDISVEAEDAKKDEEECEKDENGECIPKRDRNLG